MPPVDDNKAKCVRRSGVNKDSVDFVDLDDAVSNAVDFPRVDEDVPVGVEEFESP